MYNIHRSKQVVLRSLKIKQRLDRKENKMNLPTISAIIIIALAVITMVILLISYVKVPPDRLLIVSGIRRRSVTGKATFVIPFLERKDYLSLKMMGVDVKTSSYVPTNDYINILVDGAVKVKIGTEEGMIELAAQNFLNLSEDQIVSIIKDVLEANMREIIGQMKLQEMVVDRKAFGEKVLDNAVPDLKNMGLEIVAFNIQNFKDENNLINDLGIENIEQIKKEAAIAKAQANKEVAIENARADKESNDARVLADTEIAEKQNSLAIRRAELKIESDRKKAEADLAYEIQKEDHRKMLEQATADANNLKAQRQIEITQNVLDAEIKKQADADLYRRTKDAEAKLVEQENEAKAIRAKADAEADAIRTVGEAEADKIKATALAEAEGILKKAEAMQKYGEAAILEMYLNALPKVAENVAMPLANVEKITMFGDGNNTNLINDIVNGVTKVDEALQSSIGLDIKKILANFTNSNSNE